MRPLLAALLAALAAAPAGADVFTFETPSGNIDCSVGVGAGPSDIACTIHETEAVPPMPKPVSCGTDWGNTFLMFGTGPVHVMCQPKGANVEMFEKAPYGVTGDWGDIACRSETTGLVCQNSSGHGFSLSRANIAVW